MMKAVYKLSGKGRKAMLILLSVLMLTGCNIWEDLPECPPTTGKVWISFTFDYHNTKDESGNYLNLFAETVHRTDLFIFNEDNYLVKTINDLQGPFTNTYRIPVELPSGTYHAVAWNNLYDSDATQLSTEALVGSTLKKDMKVQLSEIGTKEIKLHPTALLYGQTAQFSMPIVETRANNDEIIPISLIRNTHKVNFTIKWKNKTTQQLCPLWEHANSTLITIEDNNGIYDFDNVKQPSNVFNYIPRYLTGEQSPDKDETLAEDGAAALRAQFSTMRFFLDSTPIIHIYKVQEDGSKLEVYQGNLMADILSKRYSKQEELDRPESFDIEFVFDCENNQSWAVIDLTVDGWRLVDNGDMEI